MKLRIFDVEHGACAMMLSDSPASPLVMIDSGDRKGWSPSSFIKNSLGLAQVDYLFVANADQDHLSDLDGLRKAGIRRF